MTQLILNKRGTSLSVKGGRYCVRTPERESFIPVHEIKSIHLHSATKLTYEVVQTAIQYNTDLLFIDRYGKPIGRVWSNQFGSISTIRKNQLTFSQTTMGAEWIRGLLVQKTENQVLVVEMLQLLTQKECPEALQNLAFYGQKFKQYVIKELPETFATFRGYEGNLSKVYFSALRELLPKQYYFAKRSQHPALDMFNCLLNYAYGMLYSNCESALIRSGIDPAVGVMHRDEYNRPVLVYDFIEAYRHYADYVVCHLCLQEVIFEEFFDVENGQFWLNTDGKRLLIQCMNDYLNEVVSLQGLSRSRLTHLELDAQRLATQLKKIG